MMKKTIWCLALGISVLVGCQQTDRVENVPQPQQQPSISAIPNPEITAPLSAETPTDTVVAKEIKVASSLPKKHKKRFQTISGQIEDYNSIVDVKIYINGKAAPLITQTDTNGFFSVRTPKHKRTTIDSIIFLAADAERLSLACDIFIDGKPEISIAILEMMEAAPDEYIYEHVIEDYRASSGNTSEESVGIDRVLASIDVVASVSGKKGRAKSKPRVTTPSSDKKPEVTDESAPPLTGEPGAGRMTAAERNDIENWKEWKKVAKSQALDDLGKWGFAAAKMTAKNNEEYERAITKHKEVEIAFIVDNTGSMGDEINFLKTELYDVLRRVEQLGDGLTVRTASVFYQDHGDSYVTLPHPFGSAAEMVNFIKAQGLGNGGDFPEAVDDALYSAVNDLKWSTDTKVEKIAFLILDAPPHSGKKFVDKYQESIEKARQMGIRIIPIVASGIDKTTEFLMRATAIYTSGTYVFITDDSGIGGKHLKASVPDYKVELLNNLMVRLVAKYTKQEETSVK